MKIDRCTLAVTDIEVFAHHGVMDQEKIAGNEFKVSVSVNFDASGAMTYDDPALTVDYAQIIGIVRFTMQQPCNLIEHAAHNIIEALVNAFPTVTAGEVTVTKVHPPVSTPIGGASFTASFKV